MAMRARELAKNEAAQAVARRLHGGGPWSIVQKFQAPEMRRIRRIHFVGIGGSGMSWHCRGIAKPGLRN